MATSNRIEVEIEVVGPSVVMGFQLDPVPGVSVQQMLRRSAPTGFEHVDHALILIEHGAGAVAALAAAYAKLKQILTKHPELKPGLRFKVRFGIRIEETEVSKLRDLGCEIEFVREPVEQFEPTDIAPGRVRKNVDNHDQ